MAFGLCPSSLSADLVAAFDFKGLLSGTVSDQAASKTLTVNGTPAKVPGYIGSGVRQNASTQYFSTTDADLLGNPAAAFTRLFIAKMVSDFTATTSRTINLYQSADNNNRLQLIHNDAIFSSSPYLQLVCNGTSKNTLISDEYLSEYLMYFVWSDGTTDTQIEVRTLDDYEQLAVNSLAVLQSTIVSMWFQRTLTNSEAIFDSLLVFDNVLSDDEKESIQLHLKPQYDYLRGFRAGRASCLSS